MMTGSDAVSIFAPFTISAALGAVGTRLGALRSAAMWGDTLEWIGNAVNILSLAAALYGAWAWTRARAAHRRDMLAAIADAAEWLSYGRVVARIDAREPVPVSRLRSMPRTPTRVTTLSGATEIESACRLVQDLLTQLQRERHAPIAKRDPVWTNRRERDARVLDQADAEIRAGAELLRGRIWFWLLRLSEADVEDALASEPALTL